MKSSACSPSPLADSRGAALILALLIVAAVSGLAIGFSSDFQLSAARAANRWHGAQAMEYLYGGEDFGLFALANDDDKEIDTYFPDVDAWAFGLERTELEDGVGWIEGNVEDAQGRFNINSLAEKPNPGGNPPGNGTPQNQLTAAQRRFIRLLQCFEDVPIDQTTAREITNAVIDWIDQDNDVNGFGGAEVIEYQEKDPPYRPANQLMKSASELRMINNMPPELYPLLEPFVIALPSTSTEINVNTALPMIMRTFNTQDNLAPLTDLDAQTMIEERDNVRKDTGFQDVGEFGDVLRQYLGLGGDSAVETNGLSVGSKYFVIHVTAEIGRQRRNLNTLVERGGDDDDDIKIVQRSDSQF